jgi:hypothetical protein
MSLDFADVPQQGGGWFKPVDHQDDVAILIAVKAFDRQRPTPNGPKDSVLADITTFATEADLDAGNGVEVKGQRIEQIVLARDLEALVGKATIVTVTQVPSKKPGAHPAWVWRQASADVKGKVVAYATAREEQRKAAIDAAPSFE